MKEQTIDFATSVRAFMERSKAFDIRQMSDSEDDFSGDQKSFAAVLPSACSELTGPPPMASRADFRGPGAALAGDSGDPGRAASILKARQIVGSPAYAR